MAPELAEELTSRNPVRRILAIADIGPMHRGFVRSSSSSNSIAAEGSITVADWAVIALGINAEFQPQTSRNGERVSTEFEGDRYPAPATGAGVARDGAALLRTLAW